MGSGGFELASPFRFAVPDDLTQILPLAKSTVPGFVDLLWSRLADQSETPDDFGRKAQAAFISEGQTIVADFDGRVAAMLISYPMADSPNPHVPGMDDLLKPLMALFRKARGTWYLHGIACAPEFSGTGLAGQLMHITEGLGRSAGKSRISLLVIDTNHHAIQFYARRGYATTAKEPVIRKGWKTSAKDWLLMEKPLV